MSKYVLAYRGGGMADTAEAQQASMAAWGAWFGRLGAAVTDWGAPFGTSTTVSATGAAPGGAAELTGYSIVTADSLDAAAALAASCPIVADGGTVDVYESVEMG
jgi:hypothetical protein